MGALVAPAMAELITRYSKLEPELISSDSRLNLFEDNIDLAIRVGRSPESNLKQRRIGQFRDVLCISRSQSQQATDFRKLSLILLTVGKVLKSNMSSMISKQQNHLNLAPTAQCTR